MCEEGGRHESYWSILDPMGITTQWSPVKGDVNYQVYDSKHGKVDVVVRIDASHAMAHGCAFKQTPSSSVLCRQPVPPEAILEALGVRDGRVVHRQNIQQWPQHIQKKAEQANTPEEMEELRKDVARESFGTWY